MYGHMKLWAAMAMAAALAAAPSLSFAAEDVAKDLTKDLTAVIALLGLPCGQVVSATPRGKNDYNAVCKDGNRYRVYTNAQGRVVAEKQ